MEIYQSLASEECVKILRVFYVSKNFVFLNESKRSVSNVSTLCVEFRPSVEYKSAERNGSNDGRNAAGISQRAATLSPHSARTDQLAT